MMQIIKLSVTMQVLEQCPLILNQCAEMLPWRRRGRTEVWTTSHVSSVGERGEETLVMTSLSTADRYRVILKQEYPDYINATFVNVSI